MIAGVTQEGSLAALERAQGARESRRKGGGGEKEKAKREKERRNIKPPSLPGGTGVHTEPRPAAKGSTWSS